VPAERVFVVVSGLAGSGKTTVARQLATRLELPLLDKDVILESLFDSLGVGDERWRARLSRASDEVLFRLADVSRGAVLDNCGITTRRRPGYGCSRVVRSKCSATATRTQRPSGSPPGCGTGVIWTPPSVPRSWPGEQSTCGGTTPAR
jgi:AAA domain